MLVTLRWMARGLALSLLLVGGAPRTALAATEFDRYLSAAISLYKDLESERALEQLKRARKVARGIEQDVAVALYEGIILADLGKWDSSRAAFRTALALDPEAKLPVLVGSKIEGEFEKIRERVHKDLARRKPRPEPRPTSPPPPAAPQEAPPPVTAVVLPSPVTPEPPPSDSSEAQLGAALQPVVSTETLASPAPPSSVPVEPAVAAPSDRPEQAPAPQLVPAMAESSLALAPSVEARRERSVAVPLVLLGAGVAAAGVGTYFGLDSRGQVSAAREARFHDEALGHLHDARGRARLANILFGTAGLAATGALIAYLLTPGDAAPTVEASR